MELLVPIGAENLALATIPIRRIGQVGGHAWEQVALAAASKGMGLLSLCNTGPVLARKQIVCMHDANVWNAPESYSTPFRALYRMLLPTLGRTVLGISTVSNFSQAELNRHKIARRGKVFVAPNGHEHALRWTPQHSAETRRAASRDTIVMIGSTAPHKNAKFILNMADRLGEAGFKIAMVGGAAASVFNSGSTRTEAENIHWLGRISDTELAALLRDSLCLAFPSLTEGFGLPVLEAMAIGCPVVVSDRASLPEICANAALFAAPDDAEGWFNRFQRLRATPALRLDMIEKGRARAARYSWRQTAMRYLEAIAAADGLSAPAGRVYEFT
jgi:glycosyltransferase involved in cell wall biosynthesis